MKWGETSFSHQKMFKREKADDPFQLGKKDLLARKPGFCSNVLLHAFVFRELPRQT
jgi:hypothetical protein